MFKEVTFSQPAGTSYVKGKEQSENVVTLQKNVEILKDVSKSLAEELNTTLEKEKQVNFD